MIVIDASAPATYILREEGYDAVLSYIRSDRAASIDLVLKEISNAILAALRRGRIGLEEATKAFKALMLLLNTV